MSENPTPSETHEQLELIDTPGSSFHYSYRLLEPEQHRSMVAIFALRHQLRLLNTIVTEKNIAYTKLHWWSEELQRLQQQQPRHPITRQLATTSFASEHFHLLEQFLHASKMDLDYDGYPDYLTLCQYLDAGSGSQMQAASIICGSDQPAFGKHLGRAIRLTELLHNLAADLKLGQLYFPLSDLRQFDLTPELFRDHSDQTNNLALLHFLIERAQTEFKHAYRSLDADQAEAQRPNLAFAQLHQSLLKKIQGAGLACMHRTIEISPVKKLFLSMLTNPEKIVREHTHE